MFTPAEVANNFINTGINKTSLPKGKMLVLGIFAGFFIALAGAGSAVVSCTVPDPSISRFMSAIIFPAGLLMVLLAGSELFTGNSLIVISVLEKKVKLQDMLINWGIVYLGNLIGSLIVAFAFVYGHTPDLFKGVLAISLVNTATVKMEMGFGDAFIRGVFCNFLVCIAVWIAAASKEAPGKILGLFLPIAIFILCGFEHSVANMFIIPAGMLTNSLYHIGTAGLDIIGMIHNLVPVTLGNIAGGLIVGCGYWFAYLKK